MADVAIETSTDTNFDSIAARGGPFWTTPLIGYVVYTDLGHDLAYGKTIDGGVNWSKVDLIAVATIQALDCWADWQTPGDSGTKIHIACIDYSTHDVTYVYIDTSDDSTGTYKIEDCQGTGSFYGTPSRAYFGISITKARGGNLAASFYYTDDDAPPTWFYKFYTSPDGETWTNETTPWEAAADHLLLFPGNEADNQDLYAIYWDASADHLTVKTYDDSGDSWSEYSIAISMYDHANYLQVDGVVRHSDGHLIIAVWNAFHVSTADLEIWELNSKTSKTARTDVWTNSDNNFLISVFIEQSTDHIYVAYARGTAPEATVKIYYKKSTDGGDTWGSETAMQANPEEDMRWISCGAVKEAWGGMFLPVWFDDDDNDLFCNLDNGISIAAVVGTKKASFFIAI